MLTCDGKLMVVGDGMLASVFLMKQPEILYLEYFCCTVSVAEKPDTDYEDYGCT